MGYLKIQKTPYEFHYAVSIRNIESDEIVEYFENSIIIESSKKNPYEDFWDVASDMRKKYMKNYPDHSYHIEALNWIEILGEEQ